MMIVQKEFQTVFRLDRNKLFTYANLTVFDRCGSRVFACDALLVTSFIVLYPILSVCAWSLGWSRYDKSFTLIEYLRLGIRSVRVTSVLT